MPPKTSSRRRATTAFTAPDLCGGSSRAGSRTSYPSTCCEGRLTGATPCSSTSKERTGSSSRRKSLATKNRPARERQPSPSADARLSVKRVNNLGWRPRSIWLRCAAGVLGLGEGAKREEGGPPARPPGPRAILKHLAVQPPPAGPSVGTPSAPGPVYAELSLMISQGQPTTAPPAQPGIRLRPLEIGDLFDEIFRVYRRNFTLFAGISVALVIPALLVQYFLGSFTQI